MKLHLMGDNFIPDDCFIFNTPMAKVCFNYMHNIYNALFRDADPSDIMVLRDIDHSCDGRPNQEYERYLNLKTNIALMIHRWRSDAFSDINGIGGLPVLHLYIYPLISSFVNEQGYRQWQHSLPLINEVEHVYGKLPNKRYNVINVSSQSTFYHTYHVLHQVGDIDKHTFYKIEFLDNDSGIGVMDTDAAIIRKYPIHLLSHLSALSKIIEQRRLNPIAKENYLTMEEAMKFTELNHAHIRTN